VERGIVACLPSAGKVSSVASISHRHNPPQTAFSGPPGQSPDQSEPQITVTQTRANPQQAIPGIPFAALETSIRRSRIQCRSASVTLGTTECPSFRLATFTGSELQSAMRRRQLAVVEAPPVDLMYR